MGFVPNPPDRRTVSANPKDLTTGLVQDEYRISTATPKSERRESELSAKETPEEVVPSTLWFPPYEKGVH